MYGPKSERRCETPRCIETIQKYGENYNDVVTLTDGWGGDKSAKDICQFCGVYHNGERSVSKCQDCGTEVPLGQLTGLFVPSVCQPCMRKTVEQEEARGAVCGMCRKAYSLCCC